MLKLKMAYCYIILVTVVTGCSSPLQIHEDSKVKEFGISKEEMKELVPAIGYCLATDRITVESSSIGYMYRETPDNDTDSGWRFFAWDESEEYTADAKKFEMYAVNTIANYDTEIIPFLKTQAPCAFEKSGNTYKRVEE